MGVIRGGEEARLMDLIRINTKGGLLFNCVMSLGLETVTRMLVISSCIALNHILSHIIPRKCPSLL